MTRNVISKDFSKFFENSEGFINYAVLLLLMFIASGGLALNEYYSRNTQDRSGNVSTQSNAVETGAADSQNRNFKYNRSDRADGDSRAQNRPAGASTSAPRRPQATGNISRNDISETGISNTDISNTNISKPAQSDQIGNETAGESSRNIAADIPNSRNQASSKPNIGNGGILAMQQNDTVRENMPARNRTNKGGRQSGLNIAAATNSFQDSLSAASQNGANSLSISDHIERTESENSSRNLTDNPGDQPPPSSSVYCPVVSALSGQVDRIGQNCAPRSGTSDKAAGGQPAEQESASANIQSEAGRTALPRLGDAIDDDGTPTAISSLEEDTQQGEQQAPIDIADASDRPTDTAAPAEQNDLSVADELEESANDTLSEGQPESDETQREPDEDTRLAEEADGQSVAEQEDALSPLDNQEQNLPTEEQEVQEAQEEQEEQTVGTADETNSNNAGETNSDAVGETNSDNAHDNNRNQQPRSGALRLASAVQPEALFENISQTPLRPGSYVKSALYIDGWRAQCPNASIAVMEGNVYRSGSSQPSAAISRNVGASKPKASIKLSASMLNGQNTGQKLYQFYHACIMGKYIRPVITDRSRGADCYVAHLGRQAGWLTEENFDGFCQASRGAIRADCARARQCMTSQAPELTRITNDILQAQPDSAEDPGLPVDRLTTKTGNFPAVGIYENGRLVIDNIPISCDGVPIHVVDRLNEGIPNLTLYGRVPYPDGSMRDGIHISREKLKSRTTLTKLYEVNFACERYHNPSQSHSTSLCQIVKKGKQQNWFGDTTVPQLCRIFPGPKCMLIQHCNDDRGQKLPEYSLGGGFGPAPGDPPSGSLLGQYTGAFPPIGSINGNSMTIDGINVQCNAARRIEIVEQMGGGMAAGATTGKIIFSRGAVKDMSTARKLMIFAHECAHLQYGPNELEADCSKYREAKRSNWLNTADIEYLCRKYKHDGSFGYLEVLPHTDIEEGCNFQRACFNGTRVPRRSDSFSMD